MVGNDSKELKEEGINLNPDTDCARLLLMNEKEKNDGNEPIFSSKLRNEMKEISWESNENKLKEEVGESRVRRLQKEIELLEVMQMRGEVGLLDLQMMNEEIEALQQSKKAAAKEIEVKLGQLEKSSRELKRAAEELKSKKIEEMKGWIKERKLKENENGEAKGFRGCWYGIVLALGVAVAAVSVLFFPSAKAKHQKKSKSVIYLA